MQEYKMRKPRMRMLQPYLPREYFDTLQHTLERHTPIAYHSEATDSQTIMSHNPFQRKPERSTPSYNQSNMQKVAAFLERKITTNDLSRRSRQQQQPSLRYDQSEQVVRRNPYSKSRAMDRRQSLLDRSHKMRSGTIAQNHSPTLNRYPKSSMSNPYEPQNKHRRIVSISRNNISRDDSEENTTQNLLEQGKRYYKESKLDRAIDMFEKVLAIKRLPQAQYLIAVCLMNSGQPEKAINAFYQLMDEHPTYRKNVYLLTAIAYKRLNRLDSALSILARGLKVFPDDYDCLIYRGKLNMRLLHYENAILDFSAGINLIPTKGFSYIGKADCLKALGRLFQAVEVLTKATHTDLCSLAYLKRGICQFQAGNYDDAVADFNEHLLKDNTSSEAHFYRGLTYLKLKNTSEALLSFDETLKLDNNSSFAAKAVEQILKIHITEKDFYEAYHVVARADNLDIDRLCVEEWKTFVEGTLLLMKKKYKQGVEVLTGSLVKGYFNQHLSQVPSQYREKYIFLKPLLHLYRAYGYFSMNDLRLARLDYHSVDQFAQQAEIELNEPTKEYNMMLIRSIEGFPNHSVVFIEQAMRLYPSKSQPYLYMALAQTQEYIVSEDADLVDKIRGHLDKAVSFLPQLSNNHISSIYYHRAVMSLYINDFDKAVADVDKAIEKSEDNIPRYFYLRGLIFACCGNFTQSVQDMSVAINLDDSFAKAYLERAKCLQMEGNPNEAFLDLQKYITLKPEDPLIHKYAGFLLFQNGAYEDCLSAFAHGSDSLTDLDIIQTKAKCFFLLGKLSECLDCLEQYQKQSGDITYIVDSIILNLLKSFEDTKSQERFEKAVEVIQKLVASKKGSGKFFNEMDIHLILGACLGSAKRFDQAIAEFKSAIQLKLASQKEEKQVLGEDSQDEEPTDYGWSIVQATFCIVLCQLAKGNITSACELMSKINIKSEDQQESWLLQFRKVINSSDLEKAADELDLLNQGRQDTEKQLSKFFLPVCVPIGGKQIQMPFQFGYPQLDPPELLPEFDHELLMDFVASKVQPKPEAPWITRNSNGVVFTPNVQIFQNLELSATSMTRKNESAQMDDSAPDLSERMSEVPINKKDLKAHFKLDSQTELKLQRLFTKK